MNNELPETQSIFLQIIANISLMSELANNNFLESEYYQKMKWSCAKTNEENIKKILMKSGMGNPAMLQMFMYALLVIPKEKAKNDYCMEEFNKEAQKYVCEFYSTYPGEKTKDNFNYYRHIRNSVAHSTCEYYCEDGVSYISFIDCKPKDNSITCKIKMKTGDVGNLYTFLLSKLMEYINKNN